MKSENVSISSQKQTQNLQTVMQSDKERNDALELEILELRRKIASVDAERSKNVTAVTNALIEVLSTYPLLEDIAEKFKKTYKAP